jgi:hypothetical protein
MGVGSGEGKGKPIDRPIAGGVSLLGVKSEVFRGLTLMTTINIQQNLNIVLGLLDEFTSDSGFLAKISLAFGEEKAAIISPNSLLSALNTLPVIDIRSSEELNGAFGAFSAQNGNIYLSDGILSDQNYSFYSGGAYYDPAQPGVARVSEGIKKNVRDFLENVNKIITNSLISLIYARVLI